MTLASWRDGAGPDAQIIEGDGPRTLELLADDEIDAVVTDPPWNLGKRYGQHDDDMPRQAYLAWLARTLRSCARVSSSAVVLFIGAHNVADLPSVLAAAGLHLRATCWWVARAPQPRSEPIAVVASVVGSAPPADPPIRVPDEDPFSGPHPCPKPVAVLVELLDRYVPAGATVIDPFAGTGSTIAASVMTGRRALGIELEPRYCDLARQRLLTATSEHRAAFNKRAVNPD